MDRDQAWELLCEFNEGDSLKKHALAVEACMTFYAKRDGHDPNLFAVTGLLHDFDYEKWPEEHPQKGSSILRERGVENEVVEAILSHATWNQEDYPLDRPLRKTLFAVDELAGFITACALIRPTQLGGLKPKSVKKKMKTASFAAAVSRDDIRRGAELMELDLDSHIANCIEAMQQAAPKLGLSA